MEAHQHSDTKPHARVGLLSGGDPSAAERHRVELEPPVGLFSSLSHSPFFSCLSLALASFMMLGLVEAIEFMPVTLS